MPPGAHDARGRRQRRRNSSSGPESATPFPFIDDQAGGEAIRTVVRETGIELLLGSDQIDANKAHYNAAFLLRKDGWSPASTRRCTWCRSANSCRCSSCCSSSGRSSNAVGVYPGARDGDAADEPRAHQHGHLLRDRLPAAGARVGAAGQRAADDHHQRRVVRPLVGAVSAFPMEAMRAIEQGRYLARAANTGISGIVDPHGRVLQRTKIFERAVVVGEARLLEARTIYARIGDLFAHTSRPPCADPRRARFTAGGIRGHRSR